MSSRVVKLVGSLPLGFVKYTGTSVVQVSWLPTALWHAEVGKDTPFYRIYLRWIPAVCRISVEGFTFIALSVQCMQPVF